MKRPGRGAVKRQLSRLVSQEVQRLTGVTAPNSEYLLLKDGESWELKGDFSAQIWVDANGKILAGGNRAGKSEAFITEILKEVSK